MKENIQKNCIGILALAALGAAALAVPAAAQGDASAQSPDVSIAEAARKARQEKKTEPQAKQVWTNENIPQARREEPAEAKSGEEGAEGDAAQAGAQDAKGAKPAGEDDAKKSAVLEAQWRQKFADAHKKLEEDEKELDLMQRELGLKRQEYDSNPNTIVRDQYQRDSGPGGGGEVNTLVQKIDAKTKQIDADKQAIDDLEDGLRKAGLPSGWSRTP